MQLSGFYQSERPLNLRLQGKTSLESVSYFVPALSRSNGGLEIDGVWNPNGFTGSLKVTEGLLTFKDSPLLIRDLEATLRAQGSLFEIQSLSGSFREGGLTGNGRFRLEGVELKSLQINSQLNGTLD